MDLSNFDTSAVTSTEHMFLFCKSLTTLDLSSWDTSNVTDMSNMFGSCTSLTSLDVSGWDTSNVSKMSYMFEECASLTTVDVSGWDTSNVTSMDYMFDQCTSLTSLDVSSWDTSNVTDMYMMFYYCKSLTGLDVSGWDTSNVTTIAGIFWNCKSLTALDVSGWDTSNVTDMSNMFIDCSSLTALDVSAWDTSNVTNMYDLFVRCAALTALDVSAWDTSSVTTMSNMFNGCSSLTGLDVSGWDTTSVTDMGYLFAECTGLTGVDVSSWDTSGVTNMCGMFYECSSLTGLDLNSWDTADVTDTSIMFTGCSALKTLTLGKNTVNKNIFESLPAYADTWVYIEQGQDAARPLPLKSAKSDGDLFTAYDYITMAGTWTVKSLVNYTVTFKVVNGSWDDGTAEDITVALSGVEGEELKLTAGQIPAVGNAPAEGYETGSWDVTPDTETAVTKDTAFTYTYAESEPEPEPEPDQPPSPDDGGENFFRACPHCKLPATGFSSSRPAQLTEQPKELRYRSLQINLQIPSLDLDTELVTIPMAEDSWEVKWLGADAGLLEGSALPGRGYSVIAGHNTLNNNEYGPFALLSSLELNDLIMVSAQNGSMRLFRVYANELLAPDDMEQMAAIAGQAENTLVLITCENESAEGGYLSRRVVFAAE